MPVALKSKIDQISPEFLTLLYDYVDYLVFKSQQQELNETRIGIAKGKLKVPEDIDADNLKIEQMFGMQL